ncbi:Rieske (2Fe-2S) protein [Helicobacter pylori]
MTTRRTALSIAAVGGSAAVVAACGDDSTPSSGGEGGSAAGTSFPVADMPEGGGLARDRVVVTQPSAGEFKAFDGTCPHQGCAVSKVTTEAIICPCHGSQFDITDGSVLQGPATEGLTEMKATVDGDEVTVS